MPSPDATPYLDLTIYDKDPQDIYETAEADLQTKIPEWVPREGNIEVLLMEALALQVSESVVAINRLPDGIIEALLKLFGVERDSGSAPVADLTFTLNNTLGYTVTAGTSARLELPGGVEPIVFTTDVDLVIAPGNSSGTVSATGDRFTADANTYTNTTLELLDSILYVDSVELDTVTDAGSEPETDEDYFTRGTTRFSRLSETLVLPRQFTAYALEDADVKRATALDNWDSVGGAPGDDAGHITVAVYGNGVMLSTQAKTDLQAAMEALASTNLQVHVIDPTVTTVPVTATLRALPGYTPADVQADAVTALQGYLAPLTWGWGTTVRRNELIALLSNVEGVDYVETLTTPASDTALTGYATLVTYGTLTITVNAAA